MKTRQIIQKNNMCRFFNLLLLIIVLFLYPINVVSQEEFYTYSLYNNIGNSVFDDLPDVRPVRGGTKFIVTYPDDWSEEQQGAFQYACELWEEVMPTTFPIRISVQSQKRNQSISVNSPLSKVVSSVIAPTQPWHSSLALRTEIKATMFMQMSGEYNTGYYYDIFDDSYFNENDITITYYEYADKEYDDIYSFSLNASNVGTKHDFITCALRDIAKGLGFQGRWIVRNGKLEVNTEKLFPFMDKVFNNLAVSSWTGNIAYCDIPTSGQLIIRPDFNLYAPNPWNSNLSLNSFVAVDGNALSQLLRWNMGSGDVCRDISDYNTYNAFKELLDWKGSFTVGLGSQPSLQQIGLNSNEVVAMGGDIVFNLSQNGSSGSSCLSEENNIKNCTESVEANRQVRQIGSGYYTGLQFHPAYRSNGTTDTQGHTLSVLKKDGTWDVVYEDNVAFFPNVTIHATEMTFHEPDSIYARNYDGRYRFRLSYCRLVPDNLYGAYLKTTSKYYLVGAMPQRVKTDMNKCKFRPEYDNLYDEYTGVIKVGLKDLEGVTRIEVAQYDDWSPIPLLYSVQDYKTGIFNAVVDREFDTRFVITAYNENGYVASEMYTFHPSPDAFNMVLQFERDGNSILVKSNSRKNNTVTLKSANVNPVLGTVSEKARISMPINKNTIDISRLKAGFYVLDVTDKDNRHYSYKFAK